MLSASDLRRRVVLWCGIACTIVTEAVTLYLRFGRGATAAEFNQTAPLLLQIHHMFWSAPLFVAAALAWKLPKASGALVGVGIGFIASDLMHHFAVLPLTIGNTGWHWP
jgi:hypothetical protein